MIGLTVAKLWADAGHDVRLASRHPDDLTGLVAKIGSHASAGTPADAATFGDVVMLTVPLKPRLRWGVTWLPSSEGRSSSTRATRTSSGMATSPAKRPRIRPDRQGGQQDSFRAPAGSRRSTPFTSRSWRPTRTRRATVSASRSPATTRRRWRWSLNLCVTPDSIRCRSAGWHVAGSSSRARRRTTRARAARSSARCGSSGAERRDAVASEEPSGGYLTQRRRERRVPTQLGADGEKALLDGDRRIEDCRSSALSAPLREKSCSDNRHDRLSRPRRAPGDRRISADRTPGVRAMSATTPAVHRGPHRTIRIGLRRLRLRSARARNT